MKTQLLGMMPVYILWLALTFGMPQNPAATPGSDQSPAPMPSPGRVVRVSQGVMTPSRKVFPVYPVEARIQHISGNVILQVTIDREGNVSTLKVVSGHPSLREAAMKAVRRWKYQPMTIDGEPVAVETTVKVQFHMD